MRCVFAVLVWSLLQANAVAGGTPPPDKEAFYPAIRKAFRAVKAAYTNSDDKPVTRPARISKIVKGRVAGHWLLLIVRPERSHDSSGWDKTRNDWWAFRPFVVSATLVAGKVIVHSILALSVGQLDEQFEWGAAIVKDVDGDGKQEFCVVYTQHIQYGNQRVDETHKQIAWLAIDKNKLSLQGSLTLYWTDAAHDSGDLGGEPTRYWQRLRYQQSKSHPGRYDLLITRTWITAAGDRKTQTRFREYVPRSDKWKDSVVLKTHIEPAPRVCGKRVRFDGTQMSCKGVSERELLKLRAVPWIETLTIEAMSLSPGGLKPLRHLKKLSSLTLKKVRIADAGIAALRSLRRLVTLNISGMLLGRFALAQLATLRRIVSLSLRNAHIRDPDLQPLRKMKRLVTLQLHDTGIGDAALLHLGGLQRLRYLDLSGTRVTDAGLKALWGLKKLATLKLSRTGISGSGLAGLKRLALLDLSRTKLNDSGLKTIGMLSQLTNLTLSYTTISVLQPFQGLRKLTHLRLRNTRIRDDGLQTLTRFPALTLLDLSRTAVVGSGLAVVSRLK